MKNILVIGVGPHARRNHLPALVAGQASGLVGTVAGVDVPKSAEAIELFNATFGDQQIPVTYVETFDPTGKTLPDSVRETLDSLVDRLVIDAVIISTEPSFHMVYTHWALERGLSVLLDKPLSVHVDCSVDPDRAAAILTDFDDVLERYNRVRLRSPETLVTIQCQRRYHPAFLKMRELIGEVTASTNCPVTSIQSFHSDGQWRMPNELLDISYHSFEKGYGKCAHSGYHFFDIVPWLLTAGETDGKRIDTVEVHANVTRPGDFLTQLDVHDYERLLPGFAMVNQYSEAELRAATESFGDVDAFISTAYKSGGQTMTLGSINLVHNGFSQRGSVAPNNTNLYKGNGRVRHESHIIEQGPFQAIHFHSLQSLDDGTGSGNPHEVGGEAHVEVHVFRNSSFNGTWKKCETFGYEALAATSQSGSAEPTQSSSRRRAVQEFLEYVNGERSREEMSSEIISHRRASTLMAGAYLSVAQRWRGKDPVATLDFRAEAVRSRQPGGDRAHELLETRP